MPPQLQPAAQHAAAVGGAAATGLRPAHAAALPAVRAPRLHCKRHLPRAALGDAPGDGEPRPVIRAQAPAAAAPPETANRPAPEPATAAGGGRGGGAAAPASSSSAGSYSDYYRSLHATRAPSSPAGSPPPPPQPPPPDAAAAPAPAAAPAAAPAPAAGVHPDAASVEGALRRAQAALAAAEDSLGNIDQLPSARPPLPPQWQSALRLARTLALAGGVCVALVASHAFGLVWQWAGAIVTALGVAGWGLHRRALSRSGAVAAAVVGVVTLGCSLRMGATLLAFFSSSSQLSRYKEGVKAALEEGAKKGGQRDWVQVLCNSAVPTLLAVAYGALAGCLDLPLGPLPAVEAWRSDLLTLLLGGFLGYYACCCGDTWASELGSLSADTPRLVTTLQPVRRGTNGGVTLLGLLASIAGGLFVGCVCYAGALASPTLWVLEPHRAAAAAQWRLIPLGLMAGLLGSLLDSLLGATLQFSGYDAARGKVVARPGPGVVRIAGRPWLSNNGVNLASATLTSALSALVALRMFG